MGLPEGYQIVELSNSHYEDALKVLAQLTSVGDVSADQFNEFIALQGDGYILRAIEDHNGRLVGIATLLLERKLIHGASKVGHIEDVAVDASQRGKGLGKVLISHLIEIAASKGCYKVILDCSEENVGFYQHCGMTRCGVEMEFRP